MAALNPRARSEIFFLSDTRRDLAKEVLNPPHRKSPAHKAGRSA